MVEGCGNRTGLGHRHSAGRQRRGECYRYLSGIQAERFTSKLPILSRETGSSYFRITLTSIHLA